MLEIAWNCEFLCCFNICSLLSWCADAGAAVHEDDVPVIQKMFVSSVLKAMHVGSSDARALFPRVLERVAQLAERPKRDVRTQICRMTL